MAENIYYNPAAYGLELVGEVEWAMGPSDYDKTVVFRDCVAGCFLVGQDSGNGIPFADSTFLDLKVSYSAVAVETALDAREMSETHARPHLADWFSAQVISLQNRVRALAQEDEAA